MGVIVAKVDVISMNAVSCLKRIILTVVQLVDLVGEAIAQLAPNWIQSS